MFNYFFKSCACCIGLAFNAVLFLLGMVSVSVVGAEEEEEEEEVPPKFNKTDYNDAHCAVREILLSALYLWF